MAHSASYQGADVHLHSVRSTRAGNASLRHPHAEPGQYLVNALGGKGDTRRKLYENSNHAINKLKRDLKITGKWTLHDLRRTAARELYDNTRDLRLVQALLGHANLAQSLWYLSDATHTLTADHLEQSGRKAFA